MLQLIHTFRTRLYRSNVYAHIHVHVHAHAAIVHVNIHNNVHRNNYILAIIYYFPENI